MEKIKKTKKENIADSLEQLEGIVKWFESQERLDVEKSLEKAKQGAFLVKSLRERLKEAENEFNEVVLSLEDEEK